MPELDGLKARGVDLLRAARYFGGHAFVTPIRQALSGTTALDIVLGWAGSVGQLATLAGLVDAPGLFTDALLSGARGWAVALWGLEFLRGVWGEVRDYVAVGVDDRATALARLKKRGIRIQQKCQRDKGLSDSDMQDFYAWHQDAWGVAANQCHVHGAGLPLTDDGKQHFGTMTQPQRSRNVRQRVDQMLIAINDATRRVGSA